MSKGTNSGSDSGASHLVFDRRQVRAHRQRAARLAGSYGFLHERVVEALADRLADVNRDFARALVLGCHDGAALAPLAASSKIGWLAAADLAPGFTALSGRPAFAADEELLPLAEASLDLVVAPLSLHWVNDLPGALIQINRALKPDGLFLGAMLGGETLVELRDVLLEVESEVTGGASPRVSPMADVADAGGLLQRAGFALPVVDRDRFTVSYENLFRLIADLRGMGETQAALARRHAIPPRAFWPAAAQRYHERFAEADGRIPATFQVIYLSGWRPDRGQQQPLRPGSAETRLAEALETEELPAGDKTPF